MSIQTINANAVIIINGNHFKANESGMWNLTEIWKTLGLTRSKAPSEWKTKEAKRFASTPVKLRSERVGATQHIFADKQVTLRYAGWVSFEFEDMVYAAFEAVLAIPEVAAVVANKMVELGHIAEAELLERHKDAYREAMQTMSVISSRVDASKPARVFEALKRGTINHAQALAQIPESSVWYARATSFPNVATKEDY